MMKKKTCTGIIIFLFFITGITACNNGKQQRLNINIHLANLPKTAEIAYLDLIKPTETVCIDTAKAAAKGSFHFQLYTDHSKSLYRIRIGQKPGMLIIMSDKNINIHGDYNHPAKLQIEGSPETAELQDFITNINRQNRVLHQLQEDIQQPDSLQNDSLTRIKKYQLQQMSLALTDSILKKARTTENPVVALFALGILDDKNSQQKGKAIFEGLTTRFPNNRLVKEAVIHYKKKLNNRGENPSVSIGDHAPELTYPDPEGKIISLSDFAGKYVLVDFWASWCAPCREANPGLVNVYNRFKDKNFAILGVSLDTKKSSWIEAIQKDGLVWKQISDLKGWNAAPAAIYNVEAIPANFLINPEGMIIAKNLDKYSLIAKLSRLLK